MPLYEYRCRTCDDRFELRRSMSESDSASICPNGHADTVRLLSMFASTTSGRTPASMPSAPSGGGCCGGACGCGH